MKKNNKKTFRLLTVLLAALAVCLLLVGGIGATRAVLVESESYRGTLNTPRLDVVLLENGTEKTALLEGLDKPVILGKEYGEVLTAKNNGDTDQYVRVTLYKYWTDDTGKRVELEPSYIQLIQGNEDWITAGVTPERTVFYYKAPVAAGTETSSVIEKIAVDGTVANLVKQTTTTVDGNHTTIKTTYQYDGLELNLEASVDAIQTHHAAEAMKASWGVDATIGADGSLQSIN